MNSRGFVKFTGLKLLFLGVGTLLLGSCRKEQPEMAPLNENCDCATEVSAEFLMEERESFLNPELRIDTDTIYKNANVRFTALEPNAEYTWYIGTEILHDQSFERHFGDEYAGQTFPMILVVRKDPNAICLPGDDGYDSIVRYLTISNKSANGFFNDPNYLLEGTFRMKDHNSDDSINIVSGIYAFGETGPGPPGERMVISNYDGQNSELVDGTFFGMSYRELYFDASGYATVRFSHYVNGLVELELIPNSNNFPYYHLKGRKLN